MLLLLIFGLLLLDNDSWPLDGSWICWIIGLFALTQNYLGLLENLFFQLLDGCQFWLEKSRKILRDVPGGFALGCICLGQGSDAPGLADLQQLGQRRGRITTEKPGISRDMLCYVMLCCVMLCNVFNVMWCYVKLCYVMDCYVMLCYVM